MSSRKVIQKEIIERERKIRLESKCIDVAKVLDKKPAVTFIKESNFDINKVFDSGNTLFYYAVIFNNNELVKYLLNENVKIYPEQIDPLKKYASKNIRRLIEDFLDPESESDSDLNVPSLNSDVFVDNEFFERPLRQETPAKEVFVKPKSEPSCAPGTFPTIAEVERKKVKREKLMDDIKNKANNLFISGKDEVLAIIEFLAKGDTLEVLNEMLLSKIDFNEELVEGYTLLSCAIIFDNSDLVEILIQNNVDKYHSGIYASPFDLAMLYGSQRVVRLMNRDSEKTKQKIIAKPKCEAKISHKTKDISLTWQGVKDGFVDTSTKPKSKHPWTPMDIFDYIRIGKSEYLISFIKSRSKTVFERLNKDFMTPLIFAVQESTTEIVNIILFEGGWNTIEYCPTMTKNTAIMFAIINKDIPKIKLLLGYKALIDGHMNNEGKTARTLAKEYLSKEDFFEIFGNETSC